MKNVLITGSARGIGREFVRQYLNLGWNVIATVRDIEHVGTLNEYKGDSLRISQMNVTHTNEIYEVASELESSGLDLLINNAGIGAWTGSLVNANFQEYQEIISVNALGPLFVARGFAQALKKSKGLIVNLTSGMGLTSLVETHKRSIPYRMSKCALHMASVQMRNHFESLGVGVLVLDPGWVKTELGGPKATISVIDSVTGMIKVIESRPEFGNYLYTGEKLSLY